MVRVNVLKVHNPSQLSILFCIKSWLTVLVVKMPLPVFHPSIITHLLDGRMHPTSFSQLLEGLTPLSHTHIQLYFFLLKTQLLTLALTKRSLSSMACCPTNLPCKSKNGHNFFTTACSKTHWVLYFYEEIWAIWLVL